MRHQVFGRGSGLRISELVLGCGTTFDSSNRYHGGEAETRLGELLDRERDDFVIITKYGASSAAPGRPVPRGTVARSWSGH